MLSPEDLQQISKTFKLNFNSETTFISDGIVEEHDYVWWHSSEGPQYIQLSSGDHWRNAKEYPNVYSKAKPVVMCYYQHQGTEGSKWVLG